MGRIRHFFREKFTVLRAKTAIGNIRSLINTHRNRILKIDIEVGDLTFEKMEHQDSIKIYNKMLTDLRMELI